MGKFTLKKKISFHVSNLTDVNTNDSIILGCLLYRHLVGNTTGRNTMLDDILNGNTEMYLNKILEFKENYIYNNLYIYLDSLSKKLFSQLEENEINRVLELFYDRLEKKEFSIVNPSYSMYKIPPSQINRTRNLKHIHTNIMIPIISKVMSEYINVREKDLEIDSVFITNIPFQKISFTIHNFNNNLLLKIIKNLNIHITDSYISGHFVHIIT